MSKYTQEGLVENGSLVQPQSSIHPVLRVYDLFVHVEGLRVWVPKTLLGFIPFGKSKRFGFYAVMVLAAPESCESVLLLNLAREALAREFAPISRNSPDEWHIQQVDCREVGAVAPMIQQPACINQEWGALWYELGDACAKYERFELAKARLWEEGFKVSRSPL